MGMERERVCVCVCVSMCVCVCVHVCVKTLFSSLSPICIVALRLIVVNKWLTRERNRENRKKKGTIRNNETERARDRENE